MIVFLVFVMLIILGIVALPFIIIYKYSSNKTKEPLIDLNDYEFIEYVSVVRSIQKTTGYKGRGVHKMADSSNYIYKVNIVINSFLKDYVTVYQHEDIDYIMEKAFEIKEHFNCKIYDCSTPNKEWLD